MTIEHDDLEAAAAHDDCDIPAKSPNESAETPSESETKSDEQTTGNESEKSAEPDYKALLESLRNDLNILTNGLPLLHKKQDAPSFANFVFGELQTILRDNYTAQAQPPKTDTPPVPQEAANG